MSGINGIFSTALSGLNAATTIVNTAASNIARAGTSDGPEVDLAHEAVQLRIGQTLYSANAAVVRAGDEMLGTLLDMFDDGRRRR
jgi:flagellar hook protein FlgE